MAVVKNLMVRAGADFSKLTKAMQKVRSDTAGMQKSVNTSCSRMSSAVDGVGKMFRRLASVISIAAITAAAKAAKDAYDAQIEGETKLATVMRQRMAASSADIKSIVDLTAAQQRLGVVGDEVQLAGAQQLATFLSQADSLKTLLPAMNDLVAQQHGLNATQENAVSVGNMMGKVMQGQTSALRRVGISFTAAEEAALKYGTEAERAAMLAQIITNNVGPMNAALAATPAGRLKQVSNALGDIKEQFGQAVSQVTTVFLPALNLACSVLASLATLANKVAQSIANVFGGSTAAAKTVNYTAAAASGMEDLTESTEAAGSAAKAAQAQLLGFDKITKLSDNASGSSGDASAESGGGVVGGLVSETADGADEAGASIGWLERALARLKATVDSLDFSKASAAFERLKTSLQPLKQELFAGLRWGYDKVLEPLAHWVVEDAIPGFLDSLSRGASACAAPLQRLGEALAPLASGAFDGLKWAYDNIFIPFANWTGGELLPAFLDALAGAADALSAVLEALRPLGQWLWDEFLLPVGQWTGGVIVDVLKAVGDGLRVVGDWIRKHKPLVEDIAIVIGSFAAAFGLVNAAVAAWNVIGAAAAAVTGALGAAVTFLTSPIGLVVIAIGTLIAVVALLVKHWDSVKETAANVWAKIKETWSNVADWFDTTVIQPVKAGFVAVTTSVKKAFSDAWSGIQSAWASVSSWFATKVIDPVKSGFRSMVNGVIGFFEGLANGAIRAANAVIKGLNKISFDIPDWVPVIGGGKFGFDFKTLSTVSLPRLAKGGIVDRPTPAIIGEAGAEAVVPLSENAAWLDALARRITSRDKQGARSLPIHVYIGGRKVTELVIQDINDITQTTGVCPIHI